MKKCIYILAAALAVAACAQNEEVNLAVSEEAQAPIFFETAPITKAYTKFDSTFVFNSAAWHLAADKKWKTDFESGTKYIPESEVSYTTDKVWRTAKPYYWTKDGSSLTFYSWSLNKTDMKFEDSATKAEILQTEGVVVSDFNIVKDSATDFIVAVPAENRSANIKTYYTPGVPTLFQHMLSKLTVKAVTDEDYSEYKKIVIEKITVKNVASKADFQECQKNATTSEWEVINRWTVKTGETYNPTIFDGEQVVTDETSTLGGGLFIPQKFTDDQYMEITYEITDIYSGVTEPMNVKIPMSQISSKTSTYGEFVPGTEYTVTLHFTFDLIYWDPAVENWDVQGFTIER